MKKKFRTLNEDVCSLFKNKRSGFLLADALMSLSLLILLTGAFLTTIQGERLRKKQYDRLDKEIELRVARWVSNQ